MSKIRLIILSALAVGALSAIASASASALSYLVLGGFLQAAEPITSINLGSATLETTGVQVICTKVKGTGTIEATGLGQYHILFSVCSTPKPAFCKVKEPILVSGIHHLALNPVGTLGVLFLASKPKNTFAELEFENNGGECSLIGPQPVEGSAFGIGVGGEAHSLTQELTFTNASSALKLAGVKANFKLLQDVTLNSDMIWGAMMS